ncbi:MAG: DevR family CRISPR-associated autoregulator [Phototrophicales bacterium]|nr:DevR family CRISPR-associated autoregulator [Phototrophicales bacterium]
MNIKSVSLSARVVMDMHALNNEGSESNRLMTRQVGIVTPVYNENGIEGYGRHVVNAISGDMNKHIFASVFRHLAIERGLHLCEACKALDPARMMGNADFIDFVEKNAKSADVVIDRLLTCALDDVCGIMITGSGASIKRKSAVEFGWTVGLPDITRTEEFIHARHAITRLTRAKATKDSSDEEKAEAKKQKEANTGQMIFNRPASSGVYCVVAHLDACAIGFNDASQTYIDDAERTKRLEVALLALTQTLLHPKGALTSTQLPHIVELEGFVSVSESAATAPFISPLADDFIGRSADLVAMTNKLYGNNASTIYPFMGGTELLGQFDIVLNNAVAGKYRG